MGLPGLCAVLWQQQLARSRLTSGGGAHQCVSGLSALCPELGGPELAHCLAGRVPGALQWRTCGAAAVWAVHLGAVQGGHTGGGALLLLLLLLLPARMRCCLAVQSLHSKSRMHFDCSGATGSCDAHEVSCASAVKIPSSKIGHYRVRTSDLSMTSVCCISTHAAVDCSSTELNTRTACWICSYTTQVRVTISP